MAAQDYPITQPYGHDPSYPLNGGFHKGVDYGCPTGTPVVVNGVVIGLSGRSGAVTGPHLHVGRWVNGQPTDPGRGGTNFNSAVVHSVGEDNVNGKYVRLSADGALWVYLHLSQINVSTGQQIKGGEPPMNQGDVTNIYRVMLGRDPDPSGLATYTGKPWKDVFYAIAGSNEYASRQGTINGQAQRIGELVTALQNEQNKPPREVVKEVEKIVEKPVEVIKEVIVEAPVDEKKVVTNWFKRIWESLFKKG